MTVSRELTVWCDNPDCDMWVHVEAKTTRAARREVSTGGWHIVKPGQDICPDCWKCWG